MTYTVTHNQFSASGLNPLQVLSEVARLYFGLSITAEYMRDCPEASRLSSMAAGVCDAGGIGAVRVAMDTVSQ